MSCASSGTDSCGETEMVTASVSASFSSGTSTMPVVQTWKRRRTLPDLLATRQLYGMTGTTARTAVARRRLIPSNSLLSYRGAWNPFRLQNMILAVGPGTPAANAMMSPTNSQNDRSSRVSGIAAASAAVAAAASSSGSESSAESSSSSLEEAATENTQMDGGNGDDGATEATGNIDEEHHGTNADKVTSPQRNRWTRRHRETDDGEEDEEDDDDDDDDDDDGIGIRNTTAETQRIVENALLQFYGAQSDDDDDEEEDDDDDDDDDDDLGASNGRTFEPVPSMRHGGCINTAAWLDSGWRLSTMSSDQSSDSRLAIPSSDCPTQLVTSGDDHLVKFWDVTHAMGTASPLAGGNATINPFASPRSRPHLRDGWRQHHSSTRSSYAAGSVLPLATCHTGHRGNVFHVTPLRGQVGKVATCGADGFLRLTDLETGGASVVVSPEYGDDISSLLPAGIFSFRPGMCFSHHFLNQHTGLLCSERGLRRFDLRLPPREQPSQSIVGGLFRACKACAVWSSPKTQSSLEEGETAYIFVGGSSADVGLCDLRMADGSSTSRIIQQYCPRGLSMDDHVSVSGLDLSRDKQELLVSYESDQIYSFPVFPHVKSPSGISLDQLREMSDQAENGDVKVLDELAAYGGHLNRLTFLKNAKYAGPRDEYVCTGSDSGHAWIYEKSTGSVVSFLNADHSTCNGVVPHPTLPIFITYGIDSTAKLWRATGPVDSGVDDSPEGRRKCFRDCEYDASPTVRKWGEVQSALKAFESDGSCMTDILPDHIPSKRAMTQRGRFSRYSLLRDGPRGSRIGNDLHNLSDILKQNLYTCLRSSVDGEDAPVESDIDALKQRVSVMRLRHQADRLGLRWNPAIPWALEPRPEEKDKKGEGGVHPADLVPDFPSDWIPYDPEVSKASLGYYNYFNGKKYDDFYRERYSQVEDNEPISSGAHDGPPAEDVEGSEAMKEDSAAITDVATKDGLASIGKVVSSSDEEEDDKMKNALTAYNLLYETMVLLKDGGNAALQDGDLDLAAKRYDKAIQYGAVASMSFPVSDLEFAKGRREKIDQNGVLYLEWGPMIRVLVSSRLNHALLMLKPRFAQPAQALEQSLRALVELNPFCSEKGKVVRKCGVHRDNEPEETFVEASLLQSKAYFRLGSAQYDLGEYADAVEAFEQSIKSSELAGNKADNLVVRRLSDAKRDLRRQSKRHRKKFKLAFGFVDKDKNSTEEI